MKPLITIPSPASLTGESAPPIAYTAYTSIALAASHNAAAMLRGIAIKVPRRFFTS